MVWGLFSLVVRLEEWAFELSCREYKFARWARREKHSKQGEQHKQSHEV